MENVCRKGIIKMINLIVAISENNVIGRNGSIPWYLPGDLARFKFLTMGKTVVMGRKTYESVVARLRDKNLEPLKGRRKIVLSHNINFNAPHCEVVTGWAHIKRESDEGKEFWVMGGAKIYEVFLPFANHLYLTKVHAVVEGDTFFPQWDKNEWEWAYEPLNMIAEINPRDQHRWSIEDYRRK